MRYSFVIFLTLSTFISTTLATSLQAQTVGLLIPLQHQAMDKIQSGFVSYLKEHAPHIKVAVYNAQGDTALLHQMVVQMKSKNVSLIAAIGAQATHTTISIAKETPVLGLATEITDAQRGKLKPCNVVSLLDELPLGDTLAFIKTIIPDLKKFTLLFHNNEKTHVEVESIKNLAKNSAIEIQFLMVENQSEAMSQAHNMDKKSQALVILKDHVVVAAAGGLAKIAHKFNVPLIASDEGSASQGADIAFGVDEEVIGSEGAKLAMKVLDGGKPCALKNEVISKKHIFFVHKNLSRLGFKDSRELAELGKSLHAEIKDVGAKK